MSTQASTYTIFIHNGGPGDESVSFQVVLSATLAASSQARPATDETARLPVEIRSTRR